MKAFGVTFDGGYPVPRQSYTRAERPIAALVGVGTALAEKRFTSFGVCDDWIEEQCAIHQIPLSRLVDFSVSLNCKNTLFYDADEVPTDLALPYPLDHYQRTAIASLRLSGGALAMGCGLGKTVTATAAAILAPGSKQRCWIVCPLNAMGAWEAMRPWLARVFEEVQIISMDSLHKAQAVSPLPGGVIIYDEAHMLGSPTARRTKAAHKVRPAFDFGLALTGTLLHAGIGVALSVMDLAVPGLAGFTREDDAARHFGCLFAQDIEIGARKKTVMKITRPTGDNRRRFLHFIEDRVVSMSFESEEVRTSVTVPQQLVHRIHIDEPWKDLDTLAVEYIEQQMADGFEIPSAAEVAHALCRTGTPAKIEWLLNAMDTDAQVVVAAVYHETMDAACEAFDKAGISYVRIDGSVTGKKRIELVEKFQTGQVQVFLGQIDAAGVSINLQCATISVCLEHSWKAPSYAQFLARTRRRGQTETTYHFDLVANTLQNRIATLVSQAADFDASLAEWQSIKRLRDLRA